MKSLAVIGWPSDHFQGFSTIVTCWSLFDQVSELYRLSCALTSD